MPNDRHLTARRLAALGAAAALTLLAVGQAFANRPAPGSAVASSSDARSTWLRSELTAADPDEAAQIEHLLGADDEDGSADDGSEPETETPEPADTPEAHHEHDASGGVAPQAEAENDDDQGEDADQSGADGHEAGEDDHESEDASSGGEEHDGGDAGESEHDDGGD